MDRRLMMGDHAVAEAAIRAGCRAFFGYPITPQTEMLEYMGEHLPKVGGAFLQPESEIAAIHMVYGSAATGTRSMTASVSTALSLMLEGFSMLAAAEIPCVIGCINRGGPGVHGDLAPAQSDYFMMTKGGGHGDFHFIVLAPNSVQEAADLTYWAFDLAEEYRNPVAIFFDGTVAMMLEPVTLPEPKDVSKFPEHPWAVRGASGKRPSRLVTHLGTLQDDIAMNYRLFEKYEDLKKRHQRAELYMMDDAEIAIAAFGITSRAAKAAIHQARAEGIKVGLIRPITVYPFPETAFQQVAQKVKVILDIEMNFGQMIEDVKLAVNGKVPVEFFGQPMNAIFPSQILAEIRRVAKAI